ncbi:MAG: ATP synthase subunit I, partial [Desulfatibacillaceae bacterium]|nr:ATP synthase subunit I [Desulfatibacillaceae bacterium]
MMSETDSIQSCLKRYGQSALLVGILVCAAGIGLGYPQEGKGFLLGVLASILNFGMMAVALPARVLASSRKASAFKSLSSILLRFAVMGAALAAGFFLPAVSFFAVAAGLLCVQAAILADHLIVDPIRSRYFRS